MLSHVQENVRISLRSGKPLVFQHKGGISITYNQNKNTLSTGLFLPFDEEGQMCLPLEPSTTPVCLGLQLHTRTISKCMHKLTLLSGVKSIGISFTANRRKKNLPLEVKAPFFSHMHFICVALLQPIEGQDFAPVAPTENQLWIFSFHSQTSCLTRHQEHCPRDTTWEVYPQLVPL